MKKLFAAVFAALFALSSTAALAQAKKEEAKKEEAKKEQTKKEQTKKEKKGGC
ncbi:MAG TPA: hypothetical protein VLD36_17575 [Burkholderiales bacterium]|jgi:hypothetical protein|nr:hypothetical protein [Burkholderiales bacterium]